MDMLTREMILQADDLPRKLVKVPEWGGSVYVRGLTGTERDQFEASMIEQNEFGQVRMKLEMVRARLVSIAVEDEAGSKLFEISDIEELSKKSGKALQRIFDIARKLSGLTSKDAEELAKN